MRENLYELNNNSESYVQSIDRETYGENQELVEQEDFFQNKVVILNSPVNMQGFSRCCKTVEIISKHLLLYRLPILQFSGSYSESQIYEYIATVEKNLYT